MRLPVADWQSPAGMDRLLDALDAGTGETRYVGGCVRDTLLGLEVSDVDLATRLAPEVVMKRLGRAKIKAVPTGLAHGTVTAVLGGAPIAITPLRRDVSTAGRRATLAYTEAWEEDAARRDFTINALSADPATLAIFDYFGGGADLEAGLVRFIGDPLTRIGEDHLRILRFFRFHARFGRGAPDPAGLESCTARANDLMALSRERIADELTKLLAIADPAPTLALMVGRGILRPVVPEIDDDGVARLARLVAREREAGFAPDPVRRLAALLPVDPATAAAVTARLRLSNRAARRIVAAAGRKDSDPKDPFILAYETGGVEAIDRLLLGEQDPALARPLVGWERPRLGIGGGVLIAMGLKPGPIVARTLQAIRQEWAESGFAADKESQARLARRHVEQALRSEKA
jgi:poly(A) polymerase